MTAAASSPDPAPEAPDVPPPPRSGRPAGDRPQLHHRSEYVTIARPSDRNGRSNPIEIIGRRRAGIDDLYHQLLTASWTRFLTLSAITYLAINGIFALLFWVDRAGVAGGALKSPAGLTDGLAALADAFFFSVQTFGTIGYGGMAPADLYTNLLVTVESFVGLGAVAVLTGIIFARVSRPTARVMFSQWATITPFEGQPTLIFRCANERANQILDAEVTVSLARQVVTQEGMRVRRMVDLKVVRSRSPLFALTWMILHVIDETSPLHGATPESLAEDKGEILVSVGGVDETFAQRIHARHSYPPTDIAWNRRLADILTVGADGHRVIDYTRFHTLEPEIDNNSGLDG
jgi:inward rectifier potassium channel